MNATLVKLPVIGALLFGACSAPDLSSTGRIQVLRNVTLIDGNGAQPVPHQSIVLRGDRIVRVGPMESIESPEEAEVWELEGRFVIPGFVDLHVHFPEDSSVHQAMLERLLEYGVTTILNPGARPGAGVALRERIADGKLRGPRMFSAGRIIEYVGAEEGLRGWSAEIEDAFVMREEIRSQAASGVDFIKLYRLLPPELVRVAIREAHEQGLQVVGHMGETTWGEAARAGVDMLVHSGWGAVPDELVNLDDPDAASDAEWYAALEDATRGARFASLVKTLLVEQVVVVPTLAISLAATLGSDDSMIPQFRVDLAPDAHVDDWWSPGWRERHPQYSPDDEAEAELLRLHFKPAIFNIVRAYYEAGVRLAVGTDVGNSWMTPGYVYHNELAFYQEAGIPPLAILSMATRNGARALGILDDVGTIEAGKIANLIVLGRDPALDINNTRSIERVFLNGTALSF